MYITLNPFFYYIANQQMIESYIALETGGKSAVMLCYGKLNSLVEKYVEENSHGVDEKNKEKYIQYICKQLSC